jgi:hypothetical protein
MTEARAHLLINLVAMLVVGVLFVGLLALRANSAAIALSVIVPAIVAAHLTAKVVVHYSDSDTEDRKR